MESYILIKPHKTIVNEMKKHVYMIWKQAY